MESLIHSGIKDFFLILWHKPKAKFRDLNNSLPVHELQPHVKFYNIYYISLPRSNISNDNDKILEIEDISEIF